MSQFLEPTWNKPIKEYDIARDPLGISRVNDRMIGELIQGFTVTTPRARYYSFYVWAIEQIGKNKLAKNDREFKNMFYDFERLYMMSCVAHEEGSKENHKEITGVEAGREVWKKELDKIAMNFTYFGNRLGGFGQNYRGSIFNIGLITQEIDDEYEKPSKTGYEIIKKFDELVKETKFLSCYKKQTISKKELLEIGEKLCLCKLKTQKNSEREALINLLFGMMVEKTRHSTLRQESLVLTLDVIRQIQDKKYTNSQDFLDAIYYRQIKIDKENQEITIPSKLDETSKKWKIVKAHDNYALASGAILQSFLEYLDKNPKGKTIEEFINSCNLKLDDEINQLFNTNKTYKKESLQELIQTVLNKNNIKTNSQLIEQSKQYNKIIKISSKINEHVFVENIEELVDFKNLEIGKTVINSILLVILTGLRFYSITKTDDSSIRWLKRLEKQDLGVLGFTDFVSEQINKNKNLEEFIQKFIQKFVITQAESIFKEKLRSNTANPKCWFHKSGSNYIRDREHYSEHRNIRFSSAISLLHDLDILNKTDSSITCTKQSQKILESVLQ
jgi:hypothetical protein